MNNSVLDMSLKPCQLRQRNRQKEWKQLKISLSVELCGKVLTIFRNRKNRCNILLVLNSCNMLFVFLALLAHESVSS